MRRQWARARSVLQQGPWEHMGRGKRSLAGAGTLSQHTARRQGQSQVCTDALAFNLKLWICFVVLLGALAFMIIGTKLFNY